MTTPYLAAAKDANTGSQSGRTADSPLEIPARGWKQVATRTWKQSSEDNIALVAAGVAFYAFLALVPLLGATVLTYGLLADPQTVASNVKSLTSVMPQDAAKLIGEQLLSVVQTSGGKKGFGLLLAIGIAIFGARNAASSIITALNIAYEEEDRRGFLRLNLLALAITAAATLYRYGPDRKKAKWEWITPGTVFASVVWLVLTFGFGFYVAHFGNYNKTYGSLATVVILVTWLYLSAYVFLFGAELNSELEHQTVKDTTEGAAKPLGERGAWSADHVAGSDQPTKPSGGDVSPPKPQSGDRPPPEASGSGPSFSGEYVTARAANRAGRLAGLRKVGMISAALSTLGLSLLRKRGSGRAGAALLATAVGLSLLKRED